MEENCLLLEKTRGMEKKKKESVFTKDEVDRFLVCTEDHFLIRNKLAFLFGVFGALRAEELAAITFDDVSNVDETTVRIRVKRSKTDKACNGF